MGDHTRIYEKPQLVFDVTSCGSNYAKYPLKIGGKEDVTANLQYLRKSPQSKDFEVYFQNEDLVLTRIGDHVTAAVKHHLR